MRKKTLALTGAVAGGALVFGTVGGAYACDLPGDAATAPVSSADSAQVTAKINQIEALVAKYDNDPKVSQEIDDITQLVESYFTDPSALQDKVTNFKDTAAFQKLQSKLAAIKAAAEQRAEAAKAAVEQKAATAQAADSSVPTPGSVPSLPSTKPHFWFHHHHHGFGGSYGHWSGYDHAGFAGPSFGHGDDDQGGSAQGDFGGWGGGWGH